MEVLEFLDCEPKVKYIVNLAANAVLMHRAEAAKKPVRRVSERRGSGRGQQGTQGSPRCAISNKVCSEFTKRLLSAGRH